MKKAKVIKGQFKDEIVFIEGTDLEVCGNNIWNLHGNIAALKYAMRSGFEGLPSEGNHYYGKHENGLGDFFHESELEFIEEDKSWYEEAAYDLMEDMNNHDEHPLDTLKYIKKMQNSNLRFHMTVGMQVRNILRQLGYKDTKYGNLDDHYIEILEICYKKVGL